MDLDQATLWLSEPRLAQFVAASEGDGELAIELYNWHRLISAACFEAMHDFEVLLRNAIDRELGGDHPEYPLTATWLLDFEILRLDGVRQVIVAADRLDSGHDITRSRVVAGLPFGFWAGLFGGRYEDLWRRRLRHAFPYAKERKTLSAPLEALRRFRNRLAHHDSILQQAISERHGDMMRIAGCIDPAARDWLEGNSKVRALLDQRPGA